MVTDTGGSSWRRGRGCRVVVWESARSMDQVSLAVAAVALLSHAVVSGRLAGTVLTGPLLFVRFGFLIGPGGLGLVDLDLGHAAIHVIAELTLGQAPHLSAKTRPRTNGAENGRSRPGNGPVYRSYDIGTNGRPQRSACQRRIASGVHERRRGSGCGRLDRLPPTVGQTFIQTALGQPSASGQFTTHVTSCCPECVHPECLRAGKRHHTARRYRALPSSPVST